MEIAVDRITAHALPRTIERVPADAEFAFEVIYKVQKTTYEKPNNNTNKEYLTCTPTKNSIKEDVENILWALEQIQEYDGLGGNTSRGYGQVKFNLNDLISCYFSEINTSDDENIISDAINEVKIPLVLKKNKKAA